jgi:WD40 repeat protein
MAFSGDGKRLVAVTRPAWSTISIWDVATGEKLPSMGEPNQLILAFAVAPDGKALVSTGMDATLYRWDVATGKELPAPQGHRGRIRAIAFTRDGKSIVTLSDDRTARRWRADTGKELGRVEPKLQRLVGAALSGDGSLAAFGDLDGSITLWDIAKGETVRRLGGSTTGASGKLTFSPDNKLLAVGGANAPIRVLDVTTGDQVAEAGESGTQLSIALAAAFSADSRLLAAVIGQQGRDLVVWDARTGAERYRLTVPQQYSDNLSFSPDGKNIATLTQRVYLWELATGKELARFPGEECVVFSADGRLIAASDFRGVIHVSDRTMGREIGQCTGHLGRVSCLAFSADGRRLASGSWDNTALVWDIDRLIQRRGQR